MGFFASRPMDTGHFGRTLIGSRGVAFFGLLSHWLRVRASPRSPESSDLRGLFVWVGSSRIPFPLRGMPSEPLRNRPWKGSTPAGGSTLTQPPTGGFLIGHRKILSGTDGKPIHPASARAADLRSYGRGYSISNLLRDTQQGHQNIWS